MNTKIVYVQPGEIILGQEGEILTTILGSCISVCLFDPACGFGGMNHYLFPERTSQDVPDARIGDWALPELVRKMKALGSSMANIQAKLFGGAKLFQTLPNDYDGGYKNYSFARAYLKGLNIPVIAEDIGGEYGRRIQFNTASGEVQVNYLKTT